MLWPAEYNRSRILVALMLVAVTTVAACAGKDAPAGDQNESDQTGNEPAAQAQQRSPDLANFPMPIELAGTEHLTGRILNQPPDPARGKSGELAFTSIGDTLLVTVCAMHINCCTERLAASFTATDAGADVMLYEYLPDVCECFHDRDVTFRLYPVPVAGTLLRVSANDRTEVLATRVIE